MQRFPQQPQFVHPQAVPPPFNNMATNGPPLVQQQMRPSFSFRAIYDYAAQVIAFLAPPKDLWITSRCLLIGHGRG